MFGVLGLQFETLAYFDGGLRGEFNAPMTGNSSHPVEAIRFLNDLVAAGMP
jgi:hypothetical protein